MTAKVDSVVIHMYTMGTGDCFVLKFMKGDTVSFKMLIDCGVWSGTFAEIRKFVETLKADVDDHVHALVVTHEHKDHVFGFQAAEALFTDGAFKADQVWMGWTEDDGDRKVKRWKTQHGQKKKAMALAADKLNRIVDSTTFKQQFAGSRNEQNMLGLRSYFSSSLDAFADLHVNRARGSGSQEPYVGDMEGMEVVKNKIEKDSIEYFHPSDVIQGKAGLEGVKIFVLGPPNLFPEVKKESGGKGESFEHNKEIDEDELLVNALNGLGDANDGTSKSDPFDRSYASTKGKGQDQPSKDVWKLYSGGETWRRIDYDWIFSSGQFALRMNSLTNNLSLALAFEFDNGKVMLFPGDAEFGSWKSWQDIDWGKVGEKAHGSRRKDLTTEDLLNRTVFYKVAHHLSHNGTAKSVGLDMMTTPELVAMATLDYKVISNGWKSTMPNQLIVKELLEKTRGRLIIMNEEELLYDRRNNIKLTDRIKDLRAKLTSSERRVFDNATRKTKHYIEYTLKI